ncbi:ABC transporter substrate-binding protein [Natronoarchaeum mannanilyticum]|uniref:ABC transporter substrate-binding protein n=1 Tax=Natronoarchaeum mannanilyticum TaxID=926360 RepID=A0AAV3TC19_9EURY
MSDRYPASALTRRRLLETAGATAAGFAGCLGAEPEDPQLEVLHNWNSGPEQEAVTALTDGFETAHPDVDTDFRPIAIAGNKTFEWVVRNRLEQGDPPSSFATRAGGALGRYEGYLGDEALRDGALSEAHVDAVREHCRYDGRLVAVPLSVQRTNCLFYGVDVVEEAGVDPDALSTPTDLLDALDLVASETDATPMAHGMYEPRTTLRLIASVLLGQSGADAYAAFLEGDGGEEAVRRAVETTERILSNHIQSESDSFGEFDAREELVRGRATFLQQGDWAADELRSEGFEYGTDWDVVPFPGTERTYAMVLDAFAYPVDENGGNPSPSLTETWLGYVAGREGQRRFNARRGTTPTRVDVSTETFEPFAARSVDAFRDAEHHVPSLARGLAVDPERVSDAETVLREYFSGPFNAEATVQGLIDAVRT